MYGLASLDHKLSREGYYVEKEAESYGREWQTSSTLSSLHNKFQVGTPVFIIGTPRPDFTACCPGHP
ncbi:MAG: hypothetical protein V2B15_12620 [Bacteroidota bacterium]